MLVREERAGAPKQAPGRNLGGLVTALARVTLARGIVEWRHRERKYGSLGRRRQLGGGQGRRRDTRWK